MNVNEKGSMIFYVFNPNDITKTVCLMYVYK